MIVMKMFSMVKTMIDEEYFNNNCDESPVMVLLEAVEVNNDCDGVINGNTGSKFVAFKTATRCAKLGWKVWQRRRWRRRRIVLRGSQLQTNAQCSGWRRRALQCSVSS